MSYLDPVESSNGCYIVNAALPPVIGGVGKALFLQNNAGFGYVSQAVSQPFAIKVSDKIDYEISFWLNQTAEIPGLSLGINSFNSDFIALNTFDIRTSLVNPNFIKSTDKIIQTRNQWCFCRFVLYGCNQSPILGIQPRTSLAAGTNLVMQAKTNFVFVNLRASLANGLYIWNFKMKPLRTPFSNSFVRSSNLIEIWRKTNYVNYSDDQIARAAQQYLLPYNTGSIVIDFKNKPNVVTNNHTSTSELNPDSPSYSYIDQIKWIDSQMNSLDTNIDGYNIM